MVNVVVGNLNGGRIYTLKMGEAKYEESAK
jgi:hypothetical protein